MQDVWEANSARSKPLNDDWGLEFDVRTWACQLLVRKNPSGIKSLWLHLQSYWRTALTKDNITK